MAQIVSPSDIPAEVRADVDDTDLQLMLDGVNAKASRVASCLADAPTDDQIAEAKLILVGAVRRWIVTGNGGAFAQQTAGPFMVQTDTRQRSGFNLWPSEINALLEVCSSMTSAAAFSFSPTASTGAHLPWCDINLGGTVCTCGATLTGGVPIYELGPDGY